MIKQIQQAC